MIHPSAARGFHGEVYEQGRPTYPGQAIDALLSDVEPGGVVVDLGAGTGKLTRSIDAGTYRVIAVDPIVGMLSTLREVLPDVPAVAGSAEAIPLATQSVNTILCASAFHWFRLPEALTELYRVLAPGGRLGLVWNRRDLTVGWVSRLWEGHIEPHRGTTPAHDSFKWRDVLESSDEFGPVSEEVFANPQPCDPDTLIARLDSTSFINTLATDTKRDLFDHVRNFCATDPDLAGRESFDLPYRAFVYTSARA